MKSSETLTLPTAPPEYRKGDEEMNRRSIIQAYQALRNDIVDCRDTTEMDSSLSLRRHHFLLMGG